MLADLPLGQAAMKAAGASDDDPVFAPPAGARPKAAADNTREWPRKTFAEQPVGGKRRPSPSSRSAGSADEGARGRMAPRNRTCRPLHDLSPTRTVPLAGAGPA